MSRICSLRVLFAIEVPHPTADLGNPHALPVVIPTPTGPAGQPRRDRYNRQSRRRRRTTHQRRLLAPGRRERTVSMTAEELQSTAQTQSRINGMGTGIIIDPRGYIITNQHVVDEVSLLRVHLADGTTAAARIVARDPETDLALVKIDVN